MKRWRACAAALLASAALLLAACGGPAPQPLRWNQAPWQDGEAARYALFERNAEAGSALFTVAAADGDAGPQGAAWRYRREATGASGVETVEMALRATSLRPITSTLTLVNAQGSESVKAAWGSGGQVDLELLTRQRNQTFDRRSVPTDTYDQRSLPLLVRALPLAQGYATQINTFLPYTGRLDRVTVRVRGREQVSTPAGTFDAWEVDLDNGERTARYWVGVEPPFPLLRIEDGNIRYELQIFEPGAGAQP